MVGNDATIKIGSNVAGALAGIMAIKMGMKSLDKNVMLSAKLVKVAALGVGAAFAGAGVATAIGVKKATDNFREFEQSAVNAASVAGKIGDEFVAIKENVMEMSKALGRETKFTAAITADALYDVASAGYDVGTMVKSEFKPVMDLAAGTQSELARTTHWVTSVLGQFNLEMEDSGRVADVFAMTIGSSKATLEKMGLAFNYAGSAAYAFGDDIETVGAILALMYNRGLRGEQAGRALAAAYADMADPTTKAKEVIDELGLTVDDVNPKYHSMAEILGLLADRGIDANQAFKLFGKEGAKGTLAAMGDMNDFLILNSKLLNSSGFAALLAAEQLDTLDGSTKIFHSALEVLSIEIGEFTGFYLKGLNLKLIDLVNVMIDKVEPIFIRLNEILKDLTPTFTALRSSVESLKGIFEDFTEGARIMDSLVFIINTVAVSMALMLGFFDKHPNVLKMSLALLAVTTVLLIMPAIMGAVSGAAFVLTGALASLQLAFMTTTTTAGFLSAALVILGAPITLIVAAIAFLGVAWATNLFGIRDVTKVVFDKIVDSMYWIMGKMDDVLRGMFETLNVGLKALGMQEIDTSGMYFDEKKSRKFMSEKADEWGGYFKGEISRALGGPVDIDFLDSTQQSADYIARESAEFLKNTMEIDRNTEALQNNILAKGNYADKFGFDIGGMSMSQSREAIDAYRRGDLEDQVVNRNSAQDANNGQGMSVGNMDVNIGELVIDSNGDDAIGDAIINEVKSVGGVI